MVNISNTPRFCQTPIRQMTPMMPNDRMLRFLASSSMLSCSGVRRSVTFCNTELRHVRLGCRQIRTSCIMLKMTPNSVSWPVPTTTPEPLPGASFRQYGYRSTKCEDLPLRTKVPMNAIHVLSLGPTMVPVSPITSALPGTGSVFFLDGRVSPVRLLSSTSRSIADTNRISAGTRSPTENLTTSPGTSSFARRWYWCPSRIMWQ